MNTQNNNGNEIVLVNVKAGRSNIVHLAHRGSSHTLCGSGESLLGMGMRRRSSIRVVNSPITCKKCLRTGKA
jgi:hypothetical protein